MKMLDKQGPSSDPIQSMKKVDQNSAKVRSIAALILLQTIINLTACVSYPVADGKLRPRQLCGESRCGPTSPGTDFHFTKRSYSPRVDEQSTLGSIAHSVIGHLIDPNDLDPRDLGRCSNDATNPFQVSDVENLRYVPPGRSIKYTKKVKLKLNIEATVEADMKKLAEAGLDAAKITDLRAKYHAAYEKINDKTFTLDGYYSEWALSQDAREKLQKGVAYKECAEELARSERAIITGAAIVYFTTDFISQSVSDLTQELQATLAKEGVQFDVSISIKRKVDENLHAASELYQVVIWNKALLVDGRLQRIPD